MPNPAVPSFQSPDAYERVMGRGSRRLAPLLIRFGGLSDNDCVLARCRLRDRQLLPLTETHLRRVDLRCFGAAHGNAPSISCPRPHLGLPIEPRGNCHRRGAPPCRGERGFVFLAGSQHDAQGIPTREAADAS
jgi:hypothetical protein